MSAEMKTAPTTIMQAVQRLSFNPESGTAAHEMLLAERARLASNEEAAKKFNCPADPLSKAS